MHCKELKHMKSDKIKNDLWGELCKKHYHGEEIYYEIERNDGKISIENIAFYFRDQLDLKEKLVLSKCQSPVLDLGCGPGSSVLFCERDGKKVTGIDASEGAISIAKKRGCSDVRVGMISDIYNFKNSIFRTILLNGNNLGLSNSIDELKGNLKEYYRILEDGGIFIGSSIDPQNTSDEKNISYQKQNIKNNKYLGQIKIKINYNNHQSNWWCLLLVTKDDIKSMLFEIGFKDIKIIPFNHTYFVVATK